MDWALTEQASSNPSSPTREGAPTTASASCAPGQCNAGSNLADDLDFGRILFMKVLISVATSAVLFGTVALVGADSKNVDRINDAAKVLREIHTIPEKDIPQDLWQKASCVIVVPNLKKAAFIVGGDYGKGLMSCR